MGFRLCITLLTAVAASIPLRAQTFPGEARGTVSDSSGLPLEGAAIDALARDGRALASTRTGPDGRFTVTNLPGGELYLDVRLDGFRTRRHTVLISPTVPMQLSIVLELATFTDTVTVTAARSEQTLASVPSAVGLVPRSVLDRAPGVSLAETLNFVPGVAAGDVSGVDDVRLSIRGAGVRSSFGSRGVLLMTDGYPVTEPDGQTPHFDGQIDLSNAERIEVVRGPSSAVYGGAALGGVINVISKAPGRSPAATVRAEAGSYAFGKVHATASSGTGPFILSGSAGYTTLDGFRVHNRLRDWTAGARADWVGDGARARVSVFHTDASLDLPGTLNRGQFAADPSQSRPIHVINDWSRDHQVIRFGGHYEQTAGAHAFEVGSYGQFRDLLHPIFVVIDQDASRYVGHGRYRWSGGLHRLSAGLDLDAQWVDDRWFVNAGGRPAFQIRDDRDVVTNTGAYVQDEIDLGARASLTLGARVDRITYDLVDRVPQDGDASDDRMFHRVSPKAGVTAVLADAVIVYGNVGTGFEAPTLGEVRLPAGFNGQVRPQHATSLEAGLRGGTGTISYDLTFYRMAVDDEILPETIDDVTTYRNVSRATHAGVEMSGRVRAGGWVSVDAAYAYSRHTLDEHGVFSGNRLPGVPAHAGSIRATISGRTPWDAYAALVATGSAFAADANDERAGSYAALSAGLGYNIGRVRLFARGENLGDVQYTNRLQVNDGGGFYYYPAPGRHATIGAELQW